MYILKALPENPKHKDFNWNHATISNAGNTLYLEIGKYNKPRKRNKRNYTPINPNHINTRRVKKELLEYHYGIYRMFPCGKQYRYHMQYIHVPGITTRNIR